MKKLILLFSMVSSISAFAEPLRSLECTTTRMNYENSRLTLDIVQNESGEEGLELSTLKIEGEIERTGGRVMKVRDSLTNDFGDEGPTWSGNDFAVTLAGEIDSPTLQLVLHWMSEGGPLSPSSLGGKIATFVCR